MRIVTFKSAWLLAAGGAMFVATLAAFQMPWRIYRSMERQDDIPLPPDYKVPAEWTFARLMYPQSPYSAVLAALGSAGILTGARAGKLDPGLSSR